MPDHLQVPSQVCTLWGVLAEVLARLVGRRANYTYCTVISNDKFELFTGQ